MNEISPIRLVAQIPDASDGDAAASSDRAVLRRAATTVADAIDTYRAEMVTAYVTSGDWVEELSLLAEAQRFDTTHSPLGEPSLVDEMTAAGGGDALNALGVAA